MIEITPEYLASQGLSPTIEKRFWSKVKKTDGCWLWTASKLKTGYGKISPRQRDIWWLAHRVSWMLHFGPLSSDILVCHHCDNPSCVRPEHLFLGTNTDNWVDSASKGRAGFGICRGEDNPLSKLTEEKVKQIRKYLHPGVRGITKLIGIEAIRLRLSEGCISKVIYRSTWKHVV